MDNMSPSPAPSSSSGAPSASGGFMNGTSTGGQDEPELCLVCNDVATGYHYGTPSCNGCKTFFRRTVMKKQTFQCQYDGNCPVDKSVRCACRHCRFKKCLAVGMNKDAIQQNRDPIGYTKRTRRYPMEKLNQQQQSISSGFGSMLNSPGGSGGGNSFFGEPTVTPSAASSSSGFQSMLMNNSSASSSLFGGPSSSFASSSASSSFGGSGGGYFGGGGGFAGSIGAFPSAASSSSSSFQQQQQQFNPYSAGPSSSSSYPYQAGGTVGAGPSTSSNFMASSYSSMFGASGNNNSNHHHQQQQQPVTNEQIQEDMLLRRLIGIEQILITIRNSKTTVQKTLNDLVMNKSVFDDASQITQMASESFQMPNVLRRAQQEDYLYWHERDWFIMIEWAKMLPVYQQLEIGDKLALLRHSAITYPSLIQCFYTPDVGPDTIVFPNGAFFDRTMDPSKPTGFQRKNFKMLDNLLNPIRKMQIDQNEFAGAKAIFFLNPDSDADDLSPGAKQHIAVARSAITNALYRYMVQRRGTEEAADKFGKLLLLGTAIATMSCEMKEAVVVADFFDQIRFSNFARQLLLARDDDAFMGEDQMSTTMMSTIVTTQQQQVPSMGGNNYEQQHLMMGNTNQYNHQQQHNNNNGQMLTTDRGMGMGSMNNGGGTMGTGGGHQQDIISVLGNGGGGITPLGMTQLPLGMTQLSPMMSQMPVSKELSSSSFFPGQTHLPPQQEPVTPSSMYLASSTYPSSFVQPNPPSNSSGTSPPSLTNLA